MITEAAIRDRLSECDTIGMSFFPSTSLLPALSLHLICFLVCLYFLYLSPSLSSSSLPSQPPPRSFYDLPIHLGKWITAAGQQLPNVSINTPVPPNQHVRLGPSRAVGSSSDNSAFFPQRALFVIRWNWMLFKCLTDQEPISETDLYLP